MTFDVCDLFSCKNCPYYGLDCEETDKWREEHDIDEEGYDIDEEGCE